MGCQSAIADEIVERGADYVLALKANQPRLHESVSEAFTHWRGSGFNAMEHDFFQTVENSLHWVLDVAFGEDDSRVRVGNAAENLSVLRRMALNMLKSESSAKVGVAAKRKKAGWDTDYLIRVLAQ